MKKITGIILTVVMLMTFSTSAFAIRYSDVPSSHWAYESIWKVSEIGAFSGYKDGTFKPGNSMTHEEFLKTIIEIVAPNSVTPVGGDYTQVATNDTSNPQFWTNHWAAWAQPYLTKAIELGLIGDGSQASNERIANLLDCYDQAIKGEPFSDDYSRGNLSGGEKGGLLILDFNDSDMVEPNTPIKREQASRIVTRALYLLEKDKIGEFGSFAKYNSAHRAIIDRVDVSNKTETPQIGALWHMIYSDKRLQTTDNKWGVTPKYYRDVIVAFIHGIIGVDNNYMYNPYNSLTRAEASTVIVRLKDRSKRFIKSSTDYRKLAHEIESALNPPINN